MFQSIKLKLCKRISFFNSLKKSNVRLSKKLICIFNLCKQTRKKRKSKLVLKRSKQTENHFNKCMKNTSWSMVDKKMNEKRMQWIESWMWWEVTKWTLAKINSKGLEILRWMKLGMRMMSQTIVKWKSLLTYKVLAKEEMTQYKRNVEALSLVNLISLQTSTFNLMLSKTKVVLQRRLWT